MVELKGGTHYLVLHEPTNGKHLVECFGKFDRAIGSWRSSGTRISPILSLNNAPEPVLTNKEPITIFFFGPVHPSDLEPFDGIDYYLSYGLYNILAVVTASSSCDELGKWFGQHRIAFEKWIVCGGVLDECKHSEPQSVQPLDRPSATLYNRTSPLCSTGREYLALMSESVGRASVYTPVGADELRCFDEALRNKLLEDLSLPIPLRQSLLVNANAALSRYTSQTYAGTSPILSSVCHYWTHSLLGIGTASLALVQIRRFVDRAIRETDLVARVGFYGGIAAHSQNLESVPPLDDFWKREFLKEAGELLKKSPPSSEDQFVPVLTYFSGRDGFRASKVALSAPLELLETCNSLPWTLLTITHEISHVIVDGFLPSLLPNPRITSELDTAIKLMESPSNSRSLLDQLKTLVCFSIWRISANHSGDIKFSAAQLQQCIDAQWHNFVEIVTQCFDFLYFYKGDADLYIPSVWASWSVIPDIEHRVPEYITRTLCALFSNNLRRRDGLEVTVDQLINKLNDVKQRFPTALYVEQALDELRKHRQLYVDAITKRRPIVLLVKHFLYAPSVAATLVGDPKPTDFKTNCFDEQRVDNPLSFIHSFSKDDSPSHARSAWLLQQLASGGEL